MQRYIKRGGGVTVEAARVTEDSVDEIANWAQAQIVEEKDAINHTVTEGLNIKTTDGKRRASLGMYVVKVNGDFFVSTASTFESKYRPINRNANDPVSEEVIRRRPTLTADPFEGMTRFGEGPKP